MAASQPHPEDGAGTAGNDGRRHAGDVAHAHGGGQGGAEGLELGNGALVLHVPGNVLVENAADGVLHPMAEMGELEALCHDCHQNAGGDQQRQHRDAPDEAVDGAVDLRDFVDHNVFLLMKNGSRAADLRRYGSAAGDRMMSSGGRDAKKRKKEAVPLRQNCKTRNTDTAHWQDAIVP